MTRTSFSSTAFQDAMGLKFYKHIFVEMKESLRDLADRHFDFALKASEQSKESWQDFQQQVCDIFPQFSRSEQRSQHLQHYIRRYINAVAAQKKERRLIREETIYGTYSSLAETSACMTSSATSTAVTQGSSSSSTSSLVSSSSTSSGLCGDELDIPNTEASPCALRCNPTTAEAPSTAVSSAQPKGPQRDPIEKIKLFLDACQPSMSYFLPSFLRLGFYDDRFLDSVLNWPTSELIFVLAKWTIAGKLTDLEAETLRIGFKQFPRSDLNT